MNNDAHTIHYWRQRGVFRPELNASINVHQVGSADNQYDAAAIIENTPAALGQGILINNVFMSLCRYNALAAAKDLLSLLVLYRDGGFYFDTTTLVANQDITRFRNLPNYVGFKIIARPSFSSYRTNSFTDRSTVATFDSGRSGSRESRGVDVWGIFAPARHRVIEKAITSYISRAAAFGLDAYPARNIVPLANSTSVGGDFSGRSTHQFMIAESNAIRNRILGTLIISAIQEGIQDDTSADHARYWEIADFHSENPPPTGAEGAVCRVEDIGICKQHAGFWRQN